MSDLIEAALHRAGLQGGARGRIAAANKIIAEQSALIAKLHAALTFIADWDQLRNQMQSKPAEPLLDVIDSITSHARIALALCEGRQSQSDAAE